MDGIHRKESVEEVLRIKGQFESKKELRDDERQVLEAITKYTKEIAVEFWKDEVMDHDKDFRALVLESRRRNHKRGVKFNDSDNKKQLRAIFEKEPDLKEVQIAREFGVTHGYVSRCVSDIVQAYKEARDSLIFKMTLLGITQKEAGDILGISQQGVSEITKNVTSNKIGIQESFSSGMKIEELSSFYRLDQSVIYALLYDGLSDAERLEKLEIKPNYYNIWSYGTRDKRLGKVHDGNIPGQIALQMLFFYTKQGDLVVDPMAGGGSTIDACGTI